MDTQDSAIKAELERRVSAIQSHEMGDPSHQPLSKNDIWVSVVVLAAMTILALVVLL